MKRCLNCMELIEDSFAVCPKCGYDEETTDERLDQLKPGTLLKERFTIGRPLGRGGFGITYIAWDNSLQRKVAIKEYLPRGLASREPGNTTVSYDFETKEAFLRGVEKTVEESRKLAGFYELESVVNVHDCFKENGTVYIVMELLRGKTVKEKLRREGSISFEETLEIINPVLKTLAAVHKTGIIHRDISPDNIFICDNGKIKLLDFGSARVADNADERSRSIVLKHGYAPKEQYTSKGKQGPFTDIYAVCATVYKMLTGITPVESIERIGDEDELQDISELVKIPSPAAKAIMKGMSVSAYDRIQSADELLEKLNEPDEFPVYDDAEATVTLYVPKPAPVQVPPVIPNEPVKASEIIKDDMHEDSNQDKLEISNSNEEQASHETDDVVIPEESLPTADTVKDITKNVDAVEKGITDSEDKVLPVSKVSPKEKKSSNRKNKNDKSAADAKLAAKTKKKEEKLLSGEKPKLSKRTVRKIIKISVVIIALISVAVVVYCIYNINNKPVLVDTVTDYETIEFGAYEQDNNLSNGKESIKWRVLEKEGDRMFVISEYALDCQPYNTEDEDVTWETCSLRGWLNEVFINEAFSEEERERILETNLRTSNAPYLMSTAFDTKDKIFLLSQNEVDDYLNGNNDAYSIDCDRKCVPTDYAVANGVYNDLAFDTCWWWWRTSSSEKNNTTDAFVISDTGNTLKVNSKDIGVRPAMWIELADNSTTFISSQKYEDYKGDPSVTFPFSELTMKPHSTYVFKYQEDIKYGGSIDCFSEDESIATVNCSYDDDRNNYYMRVETGEAGETTVGLIFSYGVENENKTYTASLPVNVKDDAKYSYASPAKISVSQRKMLIEPFSKTDISVKIEKSDENTYLPVEIIAFPDLNGILEVDCYKEGEDYTLNIYGKNLSEEYESGDTVHLLLQNTETKEVYDFVDIYVEGLF